MKRYRVAEGVAHIGMGEVVELSAAQVRPRLHNLDIVQGKLPQAFRPSAAPDQATRERIDREGQARERETFLVVRPRVQLDFKAGEEIGLPELPKYLSNVLVPVGQPETAAERVAVENEAKRVETRREAERTEARKAKAAKKK